jgi:cell division protein FtsQ
MFTINGQSFYIDITGARLPLSDKQSARLPVFTGFPSDKTKLKKADSILLQQAKDLADYILKDPFWMAQVAQIDITGARNFEIVPTVGNHIIEFGDGTDPEKKFARLMLFYKQVLSKVGMNRYEKINIQYNKQVIGIKKAVAVSKADSLKATRNIEQMILAARSLQQQQLASPDTLKVFNKNASESTTDPSPVNNKNPAVENSLSGGAKTNASQKIQSMKNRPYEAHAKKDQDPKKPKAVMPKN